MPTSKDYSDKDKLAFEFANQKTRETAMTSLDKLEKKIDELKSEVRSAREESIYSRVSQEVLNGDLKVALEKIEGLKVLFEKNIEAQKERDKNQDDRLKKVEETDRKIMTVSGIISAVITGAINAISYLTTRQPP